MEWFHGWNHVRSLDNGRDQLNKEGNTYNLEDLEKSLDDTWERIVLDLEMGKEW